LSARDQAADAGQAVVAGDQTGAEDQLNTSTPSPRRIRRLRRVLASAPPWAGVATVLVVMMVILSIRSSVFLTTVNLQNVAEGFASTLALAAGTTYLLALGLVDLSIGGLMLAAMMILAGLMSVGLPAPILIPAVILFGALVSGVVNGGLIAKARLNFFVVTLGTASIFQAAAELPTNGSTVTLFGRQGFSTIEWLGSALVFGIPVPLIIGVLCLALASFLLHQTNLGQATRAIGGNETAARLAGIPVDRMKMVAFAVSGAFVAIGGILFAGRGAAVDPTSGQGAALATIAAVLVGGTSFFGGQVTFVGTFIGVAFIAVLENGLNLLGIATFWQGVVTGAVLIAAVWMDRFRSSGP
jgi:ribose transport system permease protein